MKPISNPKRGLKFWKLQKQPTSNEASSPLPPSSTLPDSTQPLSMICRTTQGSLKESLETNPKRCNDSCSCNHCNSTHSSNAAPSHASPDHDATTPPFKNANPSRNILSSPPSRYPRKPVYISQERKEFCLARLHKLVKKHGVHTDTTGLKSKKGATSTNSNLSDQQITNYVSESSICVTENSKVDEQLSTREKEKMSSFDFLHNQSSSPKSAMEDFSNQIATIWKESSFSSVLNCSNNDFIQDDLKSDLCFCADINIDDGFDGDRKIYEKYMDMKRKSRLVYEEETHSDGDGTYSGRILTVTSKNASKQSAKQRRAPSNIDDNSNILRERALRPETLVSTIDNIPNVTRERSRPETIDERLDALVGNVLGESDDDSLDKMMRQLDLESNNEGQRKTTGTTMPSRTQSNSLPWDERSQSIYENAPDDENNSSLQSGSLHHLQTKNEKYNHF